MTENPFPGLRPFKYEETRLFFGRDGQSQELLKRLQDSRFLALVGVSGSGKSSLVRAGLLPALDGGLMSAVDSDWRVAVFRPGNNPIRNMARALVTEAKLGGESGFTDVEVAIAETTLRRGSLGLLELLKQSRRKLRPDGRPFLRANENVLLVVDQFEEIFRLIEQYDELVRVKQLSEGNSDPENTTDDLDSHPKEEASAFVKLLLESTRKNKNNNYDENVYIIVTMRSDYLGETAQFWGMPERINDGQYLIPRMNRDERREAIVGPVAVARGSIAESLVNQLLNDAGENPGHLPILQHALMRMWDLAEQAPENGGLVLDHYDQIGKLSGALSQHANEVFAELSPTHQELAAKVFKCLTEKGLANRETRRPMTIADICAVVGAQEEDVKTVVECFRKTGRWFLAPSTDEKPELGPDTLIDISHESLISGWDKLSKWVNEEAESARTYKRLADTAILKELGAEDYYRGPALQLALKWRKDNAPNPAWARRYHPEFDKAIAFLNDSRKDSQKRRLLKYGAVLSILLVVTGAVGFGAVTQQRMLRHQSERAAAETSLKETAMAERATAISLREEAEKLRAADQEKAVKLEESLQTQEQLLAEANHAKSLAIEQRDIALNLQLENQEQATTYRLFKTAFDHVASRDHEKALSSLQTALNYFAKKEDNAARDPERKESRRNRISTLVNIADVHRSKDDPDSDKLAIEKYNAAIEMIGKGDDQLLAPTLMKAGSVWKDSKDQEKALKATAYYERAAVVYGSGNKEDSSRAWVDAGKIHLGLNDVIGFQKASGHFKNAVELLRGNDKQLAPTSAEIGEAYMKVVATEGEADDADGEPPSGTNSRKRDPRVEQRLREEGTRYLDSAAKAFESFKDFRSAAQMEVKKGEILNAATSDNDLNASAEAYSSAARLYGRAGDVTEQVSVLVEAGETLLDKENETAHPFGERLLQQAADVDQKDAAKQTATLSRIASIYANLDPPQKAWADEYYRRAILFARQRTDKAAEVTAILANVRTVDKLEGENSQPQLNALYEQILPIYSNDPAKQIDTVVRFGRAVLGTSLVATRDEARTARAAQFFEKALTLAANQPDKKLTASTHLSIGAAYSLRHYDKATENYRSALTIYEGERDLYGEALALYRLGSVRGVKEAPQLRDRSLGIFLKLLPSLEASAKPMDLAEAHYAMGYLFRWKKEFPAALNSYNKALAIYQTMPDQTTRVNSLRNLIRTIQRQLE